MSILTAASRFRTLTMTLGRITRILARDIRFPTSRALDGSDAMNLAPDYSAAYVTVETADGL